MSFRLNNCDDFQPRRIVTQINFSGPSTTQSLWCSTPSKRWQSSGTCTAGETSNPRMTSPPHHPQPPLPPALTAHTVTITLPPPSLVIQTLTTHQHRTNTSLLVELHVHIGLLLVVMGELSPQIQQQVVCLREEGLILRLRVLDLVKVVMVAQVVVVRGGGMAVREPPVTGEWQEDLAEITLCSSSWN